jgi:copper chaperone NosL
MFQRVFLVFILIVGVAEAKPMAMFQSVPADKVVLLQKGDAKMFCPVCGMHLGMFYKTSHAATFKDGTTKQYCSIHCLVEDHGNRAESVKVVDVSTLKFIDVSRAHYVVGSDVKGTMTMQSKYAFASKTEAEAFAGKHGGTLATFQTAYHAAEADFTKDKAMINKKRAAMAKKGEKIYHLMCDASKLTPTHSVAEAKAQIMNTKACGKLNGKQLQAVGIFLSGDYPKPGAAAIAVPKKAKCPVCGMFVAKYPKWAAQAVVGTQSYYFDGVKDMMKWYQNPKEYGIDSREISALYVTDYYSLEKIEAKKVHYVIGSNVFGPMGHELIPFKIRQSAQTFARDHDGKRIVGFGEITEAMVAELDK